MIRAGGGKCVLFSFCETRFFSPAELATDAMLPSALSRSDCFSLGACWAFSFQPVLPSVWRPVICSQESRTWARRLTQSPELGFGLYLFLFLGTVLFLCGCCNCNSTAVVQWLVHFSTHPQVMQQHCQLSCGRHDGPLLAVSSSSFR